MWSLSKRLLTWLHLLDLLRSCLRCRRRNTTAIVRLPLLTRRGWAADKVRGLSMHHLLMIASATGRFARLRFTIVCSTCRGGWIDATRETTLCCCLLLLSTIDSIDYDSVVEDSTVWGGDCSWLFRLILLTVLQSKLEGWLRIATLSIIFEHLSFFRSSKQHFRLTLITSNDIEFFDSSCYIFRNRLDLLRCLLWPRSFSQTRGPSCPWHIRSFTKRSFVR